MLPTASSIAQPRCKAGAHAEGPQVLVARCSAGPWPSGAPAPGGRPGRRGRYLHAGDDAQEAEDDEHVHQPRHVPQRQQAQHRRLPAETRRHGLAGEETPRDAWSRDRDAERATGGARKSPHRRRRPEELRGDGRAEPEPPTPTTQALIATPPRAQPPAWCRAT